MPDLEKLAMDFFDSFATKDLDKIASFLADDVSVLNLATPPEQNKTAWVESMKPFLGACEEIAFDVPYIAAKGNVVFSERVDKFKMGPKWVAIPVAVGYRFGKGSLRRLLREWAFEQGVMEYDSNGKITKWREYWDLASFQKQVCFLEVLI